MTGGKEAIVRDPAANSDIMIRTRRNGPLVQPGPPAGSSMTTLRLFRDPSRFI